MLCRGKYSPIYSCQEALTDLGQAAAYGKCIVGDYTAVHKDMCAKEFMRLKDCYLVRELAAVYLAIG